MNINKYTEKAREAVAAVVELAKQANNPQLEPEHLLVALIEQREGIVPNLLRKMNADPAKGARELLAKFPTAYGGAQALQPVERGRLQRPPGFRGHRHARRVHSDRQGVLGSR